MDVYGRSNELVFMGFINQLSHHWGAPSCILIRLFWKEQSGFERKAWNWGLPNKSQKQAKWARSDVFPQGDFPVESLSFFMSSTRRHGRYVSSSWAIKTGWWYTYPSEKYESMGRIIPYIVGKTCLNPPTRYAMYIIQYVRE